jgi:hypothetical protein
MRIRLYLCAGFVIASHHFARDLGKSAASDPTEP